MDASGEVGHPGMDAPTRRRRMDAAPQGTRDDTVAGAAGGRGMDAGARRGGGYSPLPDEHPPLRRVTARSHDRGAGRRLPPARSPRRATAAEHDRPGRRRASPHMVHAHAARPLRAFPVPHARTPRAALSAPRCRSRLAGGVPGKCPRLHRAPATRVARPTRAPTPGCPVVHALPKPDGRRRPRTVSAPTRRAYHAHPSFRAPARYARAHSHARVHLTRLCVCPLLPPRIVGSQKITSMR